VATPTFNESDPSYNNLTGRLQCDDIPVGEPLKWPLVDERGLVILASGTAVPDPASRAFLCAHFRLWRGDAPIVGDHNKAQPDTEAKSLTIPDVGLAIGAAVSIRLRGGVGHSRCASRLIGFAPNQSLFIAPPSLNGAPIALIAGENVDLVALGARGLFAFACTIDAICKTPFSYVVLSRPEIRRLRERESVRVKTTLAALYATNTPDGVSEGLGIVCDLSSRGLALAAPKSIGDVGNTVHIEFKLAAQGAEVVIGSEAVIRNVQRDGKPGAERVVHGLELDGLAPLQKNAIKAFLFDRHLER
jgi:c-di-GMP-binding flagellar brake protein YcgR